MKTVPRISMLLCLFFLFSISACHHRSDGPTNPYIHAKTKPSEEIKQGFAKKERWWHRKKNKNWFFFKKKD